MKEYQELLVKTINEYTDPVTTDVLWTLIGGTPEYSRKDMYNDLVILERKRVISRHKGTGVNGKTICFAWATT